MGRQTLYLFPDRVLVYESGKVGAVGYDQLRVAVAQTKFVESSVPSDARVVDRTWQYVNKKGGPDRRFANNRELPICLYDEVHLTSGTGLNEIIQLSRCGIADDFKKAVAMLYQHIEEAAARGIAAIEQEPERSFRIGRNGEDLGDLSEMTVQRMLSRGELSSEDFYFDFESDDWKPLAGIKALFRAEF